MSNAARDDRTTPKEQAAASGSSCGAVRRLQSRDLFCGERQIVIVHRGEEYRLRITKSEKLILTK